LLTCQSESQKSERLIDGSPVENGTVRKDFSNANGSTNNCRGGEASTGNHAGDRTQEASWSTGSALISDEPTTVDRERGCDVYGDGRGLNKMT
jgi:hypothetical protein